MKSETARQMQILVDAHAELEVQQLMVAASDKAYFEPTHDHPLMTVTVDARTDVFDYPKAVHLGEEIVRRGRKLGMKFQVVVDNPMRCAHQLGGYGFLSGSVEKVQDSTDPVAKSA